MGQSGYNPGKDNKSIYSVIKGRASWDLSFIEFMLTKQFDMFMKVTFHLYLFGKAIPFFYLIDYTMNDDYTVYK